MECPFVRETEVDELEKQLTVEENHGYSSGNETLLPREKHKTE